MKYSLQTIVDNVVKDLGYYCRQIDKLDPRALANLSVETDLIADVRLNSLQMLRLKILLESAFSFPLSCIRAERKELKVKEIVTYLMVHSDDHTFNTWLPRKKEIRA